MRIIALVGAVTLSTALSASAGGPVAYHLYSGSTLGSDVRVYVAAFDSPEGASFNEGNCRIAADLFENQDGVAVDYWCEPAPSEDTQ